ncbi:hypothetical protein ACFWXZ_14325 [[Kitasatospora] papulosa]|uniref:hypothetical protein n=1 Tax=[Kitasatospora] papulosa TaxID=1464011 RepID=UPI0036AA778D
MMRAQLTTAGDRIRIPAYEAHIVPTVDALAVAYAEHPDAIGRLLMSHAVRVLALDMAQVSDDMPEYLRCMRAADADGTRDGLLAEVPEDVHADLLLTPDEALTAAARLTRLAARIRRTADRRARWTRLTARIRTSTNRSNRP